MALDSIDVQILNMLIENGRISYVLKKWRWTA